MTDIKEEDETGALLELLFRSLARIDALSKLLIDKGFIEEEDYLRQIADGEAAYRALFRAKH